MDHWVTGWEVYGWSSRYRVLFRLWYGEEEIFDENEIVRFYWAIKATDSGAGTRTYCETQPISLHVPIEVAVAD